MNTVLHVWISYITNLIRRKVMEVGSGETSEEGKGGG